MFDVYILSHQICNKNRFIHLHLKRIKDLQLVHS